MEVRLPCVDVRLPCVQRKVCGCGTCGCAWVCVRGCAHHASVRACLCVHASACERACGYVRMRARACVLCARVCARVVCGRCVSVQRPIAWRADLGHRKDTRPTSAWWAPPTVVGSTRCACSLFAVGSDACRSRSDHLCSRIAVIMYQMRSGADSEG